MSKSIDLYLISGFLGSGKTTFLQKMIDYFSGLKVAVLVNEFGPVSIDGIKLYKEGIKITEINNGSIFCSCLKADFIKALITLSNCDIDVLLIENSGLADPSNMHYILAETRGKQAVEYNYRGSICIVDALNFLKYLKVLTPINNQIAQSNFIIINKTDKVSFSVVNKIKEEVSLINPKAYIYTTIYAYVPLSLLNDRLVDKGYIGNTSNKPSNRIATYCLESNSTFDKNDLYNFVKILSPYTYRIKGYAKSDNGWINIDCTEDSICIQDTTLDKKVIIDCTKIVIIGKCTDDLNKTIEDTWNQVFNCEVKIYKNQ